MSTRIATAAGAGPDVRFFLPFAKVEENADGSVYVEGIATAEVEDFHGEIVSHEASVQAFREWTDWAAKATDGASLGNIREMHQPDVAGKAVSWQHDDKARTNSIGAQVLDVEAGKKAKARAYTGFSIGGSNVKREMQTIDGKQVPVITSYRLNEVSLVDKPACPAATFTLVKRASETPMKKPIELLKANLVAVLTLAAKLTPDDMAKVESLEKDAVKAGTDALAALKAFLVEVVGTAGEPDLWTIGDVCEAMRYCYSARMGAQYATESTVAAAVTAAMKKSETAEGDPPEADPEPEGDDKPKDDETDPPAADPAVPPAEPETGAIENAVKAALAPVLDSIANVAKSIEPLAAMVKALQDGGLTKAAGADDLKQLTADVATIKKAIEALPAPPPGRAIHKQLGDGSGASAPDMVAFTKIADEVLAKSAAQGVPKATLDAMRLDFVAEAMKRI